MTVIEMMDLNIDLVELENYLFDQNMDYSGLIGRYDTVPMAALDYEPDMQDYEYAQLQYMH